MRLSYIKRGGRSVEPAAWLTGAAMTVVLLLLLVGAVVVGGGSSSSSFSGIAVLMCTRRCVRAPPPPAASAAASGGGWVVLRLLWLVDTRDVQLPLPSVAEEARENESRDCALAALSGSGSSANC